jgi:hypothetical protein
MRKLLFALGHLALLAGCGGGAVTAAPPPLRPEEVVVDEGPPPPPEPTDCEPLSAADAKPYLPYEQRKMSIDEAQELAKEGITLLNQGKVADPKAQEDLTTEAVDKFITALLADPYNVDATYNLAAAYALIDRFQCSINLLERLLQMRSHPSQKEKVEAKIDLLLGRGKAKIDPDFDEMRSDARFRELIQRAGTPLP